MKKLKGIVIAFVSTAILSSASTAIGYNVVFDLGGVFMQRNRLSILSHIGYGQLASTVLSIQSPKKLVFNVLNEISFENCTKLSEIDRQSLGEKETLPPCMLHWMKGDVLGTEIIKAVDSYYKTAKNTSHQVFVKRMCEAIFDPALFMKTTDFYECAFTFLQTCIDQGHKIYVLSNLDKESYECLSKEMPKFFEKFDGVIISAHIGIMKPNPDIFSYLLKTYELNAEDTVFIDDQQENIDAARQAGIFPILCKKTGWFYREPNFSSIEKIFNSWAKKKTEK